VLFDLKTVNFHSSGSNQNTISRWEMPFNQSVIDTASRFHFEVRFFSEWKIRFLIFSQFFSSHKVK